VKNLLLSLTLLVLAGCTPEAKAPVESEPTSPERTSEDRLREALSFHASLDNGPDADFARGDATLYTAPSYDEQASAAPGIGNPDVQLATGAGRFGGALNFTAKNVHAIFYRADGNVAHTATDWSGTISFWLSLDPAVDLAPGYCDPIQITDSRYNDAAVWVDFTRENPRQFRLGIFGDLHAWNPEELAPDDFPFFGERVIAVDEPPFAADAWTHVVITYSGLGSDAGGTASLYLNGVAAPKTVTGIDEPFTWDGEGTVRLGVNYVGLYDELALFDRALNAEEVASLHALETGVAALHP
jgi:hypothetical protein